MSFIIELTDDAWDDAFQIIKWYDEQKQGLGNVFLDYLDDTLKKIEKVPTAYKIVYRQVRQASLQKFPYVVLYKVVKNTITVHCIFHTSQDPKKMIKRLRKK